MRLTTLVYRVVILLIVVGTFFVGSSSTARADSGDQLARGKEMFRIRCEPCHGDEGQGLAVWRATWAPEDQNCSQPKCHARNHPPDGFYMPNDAPPIIGANTLKPFPTARELFTFISKTMPFDKPGELSQDDYWAITAFLLLQNNKLPAGIVLGTNNASTVAVNPAFAASAPSSGSILDDRQWIGIPIFLGLAVLVFLISRARKR